VFWLLARLGGTDILEFVRVAGLGWVGCYWVVWRFRGLPFGVGQGRWVFLVVCGCWLLVVSRSRCWCDGLVGSGFGRDFAGLTCGGR
jgi:hypothetical protein